ncbi:MAG: response regulator [Candidatus Poribacteria bacterium]|nr:response regulator [Candidatus Poribacteria bacterium]
MKVLVVDDSRTMRRMIIKHLTQLGIDEVVEAGDGEQALLELVKVYKVKEKIDLILTDWNMPTMTGLDFVKAVRQRTVLDKVPIIMITTNNTKADVVAAVGVGINNYITKPFTPDTLREKIVDTLKKFHGI